MTLAGRHGINPRTVAKWRKRNSVSNLPTGPRDAKSTVLSIQDEAIVVAFRKHTPLPLDDRRYALHASLPHPTRSSWHRCLRRHDSSGCPTPMAGSRSGASSGIIRSASSMPISPRSARNRESSVRSHTVPTDNGNPLHLPRQRALGCRRDQAGDGERPRPAGERRAGLPWG